MRKLTVKRRKSFVGCLAKVKIYIEDLNGDTIISGIKCKLLGKLKNNSSATFEIGNDSCRLFAIYGKMSKSFCNDLYVLPAGEEDIELSGAPRFMMFGNPFIFDGNFSEEAFNNRMRVKKKATLIMLPIFIVAFIAGFILGRYIYTLLF